MESIWSDNEALWGLLFFIWILVYSPVLLEETAEVVAKIPEKKPSSKPQEWLGKFSKFKLAWFVGLLFLFVAWLLEIPAQAASLLVGVAALICVARAMYKFTAR